MERDGQKEYHAGRLDVLLAKAVTPALLLAGLLALLVFHFGGTLTNLEKQQDTYNDVIGLSNGKLSLVFHRDSGTGRPSLTFNGQKLLDYVDSASTISVDGQTQPLWNGDHGYTVDTTKRQVVSTSSGSDWQVVEVAALSDVNTVTINYSFVSMPKQGTGPRQVVLYIAHSHRAWLAPNITGASFDAIVLPEPAVYSTNATVVPTGKLSVAVSGRYVKPGSVALDMSNSGTQAGTAWTTAFTTTFEIDNPSLGTLIPLGSETIRFQQATASVATPVVFPLSQP